MGCVACLLREKGLFDASAMSKRFVYTYTCVHVLLMNIYMCVSVSRQSVAPSPQIPSPSTLHHQPQKHKTHQTGEDEAGANEEGGEWGAYILKLGSLREYVRIDR